MSRRAASVALLLLAAWGCGDEPAIPGVVLRFEPESTDFWASPFPAEQRRGQAGRVDLSHFPNPDRNEMAEAMRSLLAREAFGFGRSSAVYFAADGALAQPTLGYPEVMAAETARVALVRMDQGPFVGVPIDVSVMPDGGPYGAPNMLALLPLQGRPLAPNATYMAFVRRSYGDESGAELGVPASTRALLAGDLDPGGLDGTQTQYENAVHMLEDAGVALDQIAALTVFETDDPTATMASAVEQALLDPLPALAAPLVEVELFPDFCVLEGTLDMPVFQTGEPPYADGGGAWAPGLDGKLGLDHTERARLVLTLPRSTRPSAGWPTVLFIRTGGGGERPLVDRGLHGVAGGPSLEPGSGPARNFARAGWAGVSVDGPHGGLRNVSGGDEQFLIFNFANPVAMRDNLRQSALELVLITALLPQLAGDSADCGPVAIDGEHLALFGHSMGATIGPLVLANQPKLEAGIFSGAGGSWIENVLYKEHPVVIKPLAELLVGYGDHGRSLSAADPILNMLQWAGEPADPPLYGERIHSNVLMFQGIDDTYIPPPVANALSLALDLDALDPVLDEGLPPLLALANGAVRSPPLSANRGERTRVLAQHQGDGLENGHEVVFQTAAPKHQYRCFLESLRVGPPKVPADGAEDAPCD